MIYHLSFFIFSIFISYFDCTKLRIPNVTLIALLIFLFSFGYLENQINYYSLIISFLILIFFIVLLFLMPKQILGGGDIKYMVVISIYLSPLMFPLFLLLTGLVQLVFLVYYQKIRRRRVAPMAPAMFLAVILVKINEFLGFYAF